MQAHAHRLVFCMAYANLPQWAFLHRWRALPETFVHFVMFIDTFKSFSLTFYCIYSFTHHFSTFQFFNFSFRLGDILFAYPTNFSLSTGNKNYIGYLELQTCNNEKSVIVRNASFRLASRSFENTGPNNSAIFNRRIDGGKCFGGHHVLKTATRTSLL